jgi:hypothetical protein
VKSCGLGGLGWKQLVELAVNKRNGRGQKIFYLMHWIEIIRYRPGVFNSAVFANWKSMV